MTIRLMQLEDYETVYALWLSCQGMGLNTVDDTRDGISRFLKRNPNTCFVAEEGGQLLGAILVGNDGRRGYIYHTAVSPAFQRRGLGTALVQRAMAALEAEGIAKVALVVFGRNQLGNAFWEKVGFTVREDLVYRNCALRDIVRIDT